MSSPHHEIFSANIAKPKGMILLGHAMFNKPEYYLKPKGLSFVDYLTSNGYDVIVISLTGYHTQKATKNVNFDVYVEDYLKIIKNVILKKDLPLHYIGHSVGSLTGLSAILKSKISVKTLVLIAPAIWGFTVPIHSIKSIKQRIKISLAHSLSTYLGYLPSKLFRIGDTNPPAGYFSQFKSWINESNIFSVEKDCDYMQLWQSNTNRTFIFQAEKDQKMAPKENVLWVSNNIGSQVSIITINKLNFGYKSDHFTIIYGKNAAESVWPKIVTLLESTK